MNQTAIFWPMLAQVLLAYIVYAVLGRRRFGPLIAGTVRPRVFANRGGEPEGSATASNNLMNQFELPVLFYALCLSLYVTAGVWYLTVAVAWLFVVLRYAHALVHLTSNRLGLRSALFAAGYAMLGLGWILFALRIAGGP
jgi:hypothetical protein